MKRITLFAATLLITFYALSSFSNNAPGVVIEDKAAYPLYKYSKIIKQDQQPSLYLNNFNQDISSVVTGILDSMGVPFEIISNSPATFQTGWISWHYDNESKKTLSSHTNRFFRLNTRDKYKFRISIRNDKHQTLLVLDEVNREHEVDITPDTEMVWLKWKPAEPDNNAITAFMKRLQTEYEIQALASDTPVIPEVNNAIQPDNNYVSLNMTAAQAWSVLIRQLANHSISLASTHETQHMVNTEWVYASFNPTTKRFDFSDKETQRHQFQLMVIPGSTKNVSSIFAYHTGFQQKTGTSAWTDEKTQEDSAAAFLNSLSIQR